MALSTRSCCLKHHPPVVFTSEAKFAVLQLCLALFSAHGQNEVDEEMLLRYKLGMKMKHLGLFLFAALTLAAADPYAPPFYNNEKVELPSWVREEFRDINAKLREKLSPSDYLEVLKGEYYLLHDVPSRSHALRGRDSKGNTKSQELVHPDKLRAKLQQILDDPENEVAFARAHFVRPKEDGVFFREDLRYAEADLYWEDDLYVVGRSDSDVHVTASICDFWNARTCRKDTSFAIPTTCYLHGGGDGAPLFRLKGTDVYSPGFSHGRECRSQMWAGSLCARYLMIPQRELFASSSSESPFLHRLESPLSSRNVSYSTHSYRQILHLAPSQQPKPTEQISSALKATTKISS